MKDIDPIKYKYSIKDKIINIINKYNTNKQKQHNIESTMLHNNYTKLASIDVAQVTDLSLMFKDVKRIDI